MCAATRSVILLLLNDKFFLITINKMIDQYAQAKLSQYAQALLSQYAQA